MIMAGSGENPLFLPRLPWIGLKLPPAGMARNKEEKVDVAAKKKKELRTSKRYSVELRGHSMAADEILVKRAQGGDLAAYGELVGRCQDRVYGLAARLLTTTEDARDAAQEIFIRAFRSLPGFDFRADFATWLYRVATNVCLDQLTRRRREALRYLPLEDEPRRRRTCFGMTGRAPRKSCWRRSDCRKCGGRWRSCPRSTGYP